MAEVLLGSEWIAVEETAQDVTHSLGDGGGDLAVPMSSWIALTATEYFTASAQGAPNYHPPQRMKVAVSAIHAVREAVEK
jgi:hypothetical protein